VASFLRAAAPTGRAVLNLIPYNPGASPIGRAPTETEIGSFAQELKAAGVFVKLRSPRGRGLQAACGQLGRVDQSAAKTKEERKMA
jgi:23S rRNA (adenine2503-C2)-methyltransferase